MKNTITKLTLCMLLVLLAQSGLYAQVGVLPNPYCVNINGNWSVPCNQPNPPNTPGNSINDFIDSFNTTGGIIDIVNNNSTCNSQVLPGLGQVNYMYWGCSYVLQTIPGAVITCNMRSGTTWSQGFAIWVDWNNDGVFANPGEKVVATNVAPAYTWVSGNFNVPAGQAAGVYRMRVRCSWATTGTNIPPCTQQSYGEAEDYNLYVNQTPAGLITATAGVISANPICSSQTATLDANSTYTGALTYTWTGPGGFTSNLKTPVIPNAQVAAGGIYNVVVDPGACPVSKSVTLTVNPTPTLTAANNAPICQGANINLTTPAVPGGTSVAYAWTGPGTYTSSTQNPVLANAQPTNTGVYTITATNYFANGGSCQSNTTTNVGIVPVNQITVTPNFTLCQGSNLNLKAANLVTPISYSWTGPSSFTSTLQNPSINTIGPPVSGNYYVIASFSVSGIPLICTSTAVTNVSVVATSPIAVTAPNNICQDGTANITASANPVPLAYAWTGPNNFVATGASTSIANILPAASGIYQVTGTWAIGTVSCNVGGFNQISVVAVNPITINAPISTCYPANVPLTAYSQGAVTYSWTGPNSFSSTAANPYMITPMPSISGVYSVTTGYTNGMMMCYSGSTTEVTVNPILPFTLPAFKQTCFNSAYVVGGPAGATSYTWTGPNGFTSNNQALNIPAVQANQSGDYFLSVNLGPCITSGSTKVEVLSPMAFTQVPGNQTLCKGDKVNLTLNAAGGSRNYAYDWNPSIYITSPTGSVQTCQPDNTTIYNVTGYDISCPDFKISTSVTVTVNKAPEPKLNLETNQGCQPLCMTYNSKTQAEAALITYDFGNGNVMQNDNFPYCLNEPGTYNLKITTKGINGCSAVFTLDPITVWPTSHTELNWTPDVPSTTNNNVTFEPNSQYEPVTYEWTFQGASGTQIGAQDTSSLKNPARLYDNVGKYPVMLVTTTDRGCKETIFKLIDIRDDFTVFIPNSFTPNGDGLNDVFSVKGVGVRTDGFVMDIYDRWGSLIYSTKDIMKGWDGTNKGIKVENGTYVYKIRTMGANGEGKKEFVGHITLLK